MQPEHTAKDGDDMTYIVEDDSDDQPERRSLRPDARSSMRRRFSDYEEIDFSFATTATLGL